MTPKSQPSAEKIAALQKALEEYTPGESGLFDQQAEEAKSKVRARALGLLDQRARSRHELQDRLVAAEFDPVLVDEVLDDLERTGLVDDASFAYEWVRQRHTHRGKSRRILNQELIEKGVGQGHREEALAQIEPEDESSVALAVARKAARRVRSVPEDYTDKQKALRRIVGSLARRGFGHSLSMDSATRALEERIAELA